VSDDAAAGPAGKVFLVLAPVYRPARSFLLVSAWVCAPGRREAERALKAAGLTWRGTSAAVSTPHAAFARESAGVVCVSYADEHGQEIWVRGTDALDEVAGSG